jgi:hypothetical protein
VILLSQTPIGDWLEIQKILKPEEWKISRMSIFFSRLVWVSIVSTELIVLEYGETTLL